MASGKAEVGLPLTPEDRLRLAVRYLSEDLGRRYVERTSDENSLTIRLTPTKFIEYNGRAGRTTT